VNNGKIDFTDYNRLATMVYHTKFAEATFAELRRITFFIKRIIRIVPETGICWYYICH